MRVLESAKPGFPAPETWDSLVAQDPRGHLLQTWAWGELKGAFGWIPVRFAVERDGTLIAGAQVLYRRIGPVRLAYIPKGPILVEDTPEALEVLWRAVHRRSRRMRAVSLKVEPEWPDQHAHRHDSLAAHGFHPSLECIQPRRTIIVDLTASEKEILARMKSKWRYNIRLSARKGVVVCPGEIRDIEAFYRLMRVTGQRDQFAIHSLDYYRRAMELFTSSGRVRLLLAYYEGQLLAGLMAYAFNRQSWYMYGASSDAYRQFMPNHQLQWRAMQWAREKGCTHYDLWGIADTDPISPSAGLSGVQRFKAGFGGEVMRYVGSYDYVYSMPLYRLMRLAWTRRRLRSRARP